MDGDLAARRRDWFKDNKRRRMSLYFESEEQRDRMEALAHEAGYKRFSTWCLDRIEAAASGQLTDPRYVERLEAEIEKLEAAVRYERSVAEENRIQADELATQVQDLAQKFAEVALRGNP